MAKVLAVEDEPLVRAMVVETLENAGHTVLDAPDGEAALAIIRNAPDLALVVTDIRMPRMDGFALALAARQLRPDLGLVFMTGYSELAAPAGLAGVKTMRKPFDPDELISVVDEILD